MIPSARQQLALDSKNLGGDNEAELKSRFDSQSDILLGGDSIVAAEKKIIRPSFMLPPGLDDFGRQLTAHSAQFVAADGDRPSGYLLTGVTAPRPLLSQPTRKIGDMPVIVTPHDAKWLAEDQVFVVSAVSFEFLSAGSNWRDHASTRELIHELRSPSTDLGADVRYAIHSRLMQPFLDTTLLFLGLPLIISKGNRNPFIAIGMCVAVVALFMTIRLGCQSLCLTGWLQAPFAAWLPLMIFAPLAVLMAEPLRQ
jgi:lipopolysaccharide export system permease protein